MTNAQQTQTTATPQPTRFNHKQFTLAELKAAIRQVKIKNPAGADMDLGDGFVLEYRLILASRRGVRFPVSGTFALRNHSLFPHDQWRYTLSLDVKNPNTFSVAQINKAILESKVMK